MNNYISLTHRIEGALIASEEWFFSLPVDATLISVTAHARVASGGQDEVEVKAPANTTIAVTPRIQASRTSYASSDESTIAAGNDDPINAKFIPAGTELTVGYNYDSGVTDLTMIVLLST